MYVTGLGGAKPAQTNAGGGGGGGGRWVEVVSLLQNHTVEPHTLRQNLGLGTKTHNQTAAWIQELGPSRRERNLLCCSHGEVSDPHHHPGERPPAYDQPLLPGREGPRAEPRASYAGQGSGRPAPVPCPDGAAGVRQQQPSFWHPAAQRPPR